MQIYIFLFIFKSLPPGQLAAGPLPPTGRAVGVQICKMFNRKYISVKNIFKKYKNKKDAAGVYSAAGPLVMSKGLLRPEGGWWAPAVHAPFSFDHHILKIQ